MANNEPDVGLLLIGLIIGMILGCLVVGLPLSFNDQKDKSREEACFTSIGDYKTVYIHSEYYCIKTTNDGSTKLYKLINIDNQWKVSKEVTTVD